MRGHRRVTARGWLVSGPQWGSAVGQAALVACDREWRDTQETRGKHPFAPVPARGEAQTLARENGQTIGD